MDLLIVSFSCFSSGCLFLTFLHYFGFYLFIIFLKKTKKPDMTASHFNLLCVLIYILGSFCHVFRLQDVEKSLFLRTLYEYSVGPLPAWQ